MKKFDLEAAKAGAPVQTRQGYPVKILTFDRLNDAYPIVALFENEGEEFLAGYTIQGRYYYNGNKDDKDLVMTPTKRIGWISIYRTGKRGERVSSIKVYESKEEALKYTSEYCLDTIQIEWEE